ncbi:unnamed protein product [Eruca vesicaria subsp. sativa]|uniref:Uncharacterized protein n=1 Tax=Eruca vesicaria subsp. sativa TaxID=29727 RepID=A0ABC8LWM4_ERUVS|nr:unnamed protein product [Eruca vesicaria subsp. sativa]
MWLSPTILNLHRITWDDHASLVEKTVAYEVTICQATCVSCICSKSHKLSATDQATGSGGRPITETTVAEKHTVRSSAKEPHVSATEREIKNEPKAEMLKIAK